MSIGNKPVNPIPMTTYQELGLTYREWLIGMLASSPKFQTKDESKTYTQWELNGMDIIRQADAIIKQLDKESDK